VLKYQLIRLRTLGNLGRSIWRDRIPSEIRYFFTSAIATPALQRVAYKRLTRIGGVKLAGLDEVSFDTIIHANHHVDRQ